MITALFWWFIIAVPTALVVGRLISVSVYIGDQLP